jgi:hypothetical protein
MIGRVYVRYDQIQPFFSVAVLVSIRGGWWGLFEWALCTNSMVSSDVMSLRFHTLGLSAIHFHRQTVTKPATDMASGTANIVSLFWNLPLSCQCQLFSGAFAEFQNVTISFMSVCLSTRLHRTTQLPLNRFSWVFFMNLSRKFKFH